MSYTKFHHWGVRTQEQIQRLQQTSEYGSAYNTTEPRLLQDGQSIIDRGLEGVMRWSKNPVQDASNNYYNGCFMSSEFSQWWATSGGFQNKWYTGHNNPQDEEIDLGSSATDAELAVGVSYNTLYGSATQVGGVTVGDYLQLKTSGITDVDYSGVNNPEIGELIEEGNTDGKVDISATKSNTFGWVVNTSNVVGTAGSLLMKINTTETA
jgi:hypothetical protein